MHGLQTFLNLYVRFAKPETNAKFEEEIKLLTNNNITMGIEEFVLDRAKKDGIAEGKAEGEVKGNSQAVKNLITKMGLTNAQISDVLEVPISFVENIRQELKK